MLKKHHNLSYIIDRSRSIIWSKLNPDTPWLSKDMVNFLDSYLKKDHVMLETGSGRSTIWFAKRIKEIVSIEHNEAWHEIVQKDLEKKNVDNVSYHFASEKYNGSPFDSEYVKAISTFPEAKFDVVLIDGVLRGEVALAAYDKVKTGGLIVIDNVERYLIVDTKSPERISSELEMDSNWTKFSKMVETFKKEVYTDNVTATMVIYKV